jgi:hypothetical protein
MWAAKRCSIFFSSVLQQVRFLPCVWERLTFYNHVIMLWGDWGPNNQCPMMVFLDNTDARSELSCWCILWRPRLVKNVARLGFLLIPMHVPTSILLRKSSSYFDCFFDCFFVNCRLSARSRIFLHLNRTDFRDTNWICKASHAYETNFNCEILIALMV